MRKATVCVAICRLLYAKRPPFAGRKAAYWKVPDCQRVTDRSQVGVWKVIFGWLIEVLKGKDG